MRSKLDRMMHDTVGKFPSIVVTDLLTKKLEAQGIADAASVASRLAEKILAGDGGPYVIDEGSASDAEIVLEFTNDDAKYLSSQTDAVLEALPSIITDSVEETSSVVARRARQAWDDAYGYSVGEVAAFKFNLDQRWGKGLRALKFLISLSLELGTDYAARAGRSRSRRDQHLRAALPLLHARCCQISSEVVALLENGFADGAMARWRTLHEVTVVANVIREAGDETARRYLDYEAVESKRAMDVFRRTHAALGWKPPSQREIRAVDAAFEDVKRRYGRDFCGELGWATVIAKNTKPKFSHLEELAGQAMMRSHYKMASYNVHAGVKGIVFRLGVLSPDRIALAGPSNAGLEEPAHNTAMTLLQANIPLVSRQPTLDAAIKLKVLNRVQEEAVSEFIRAGRKLQADENRWQREIRAGAGDK